MTRLLTPDLRLESACELSLERVRGMGLSALLLDVDCTLTRYCSFDIAPEVSNWLAELRQGGIALCLLSNGVGRRIEKLAGQLDLPFVAAACKPLPWGCWRAVRTLGVARSQTGLIGDQLFADVLAARLAGLAAILVRPIHPEDEPWFTRLKRRPERILLRRM